MEIEIDGGKLLSFEMNGGWGDGRVDQVSGKVLRKGAGVAHLDGWESTLGWLR
ncbi:MAG: hypothetical protein JO057_01940 [Chloroflexi bacterium]|nr:hypothetical protein [Chloroflexota bacterium]